MSEIFNHIFSLQHVYQVQYVMLHTCTRIDKTGKNIDCKNCSFTSNLHFFWGGVGTWTLHLQKTLVLYTTKCLQTKENSHSLEHVLWRDHVLLTRQHQYRDPAQNNQRQLPPIVKCYRQGRNQANDGGQNRAYPKTSRLQSTSSNWYKRYLATWSISLILLYFKVEYFICKFFPFAWTCKNKQYCIGEIFCWFIFFSMNNYVHYPWHSRSKICRLLSLFTVLMREASVASRVVREPVPCLGSSK